MNQVNQTSVMETRIHDVILFKNQEEFAKALREGTGMVEENGLAAELTKE